MPTLHDFTADTLEGQPRSLADFRGQVVLVVNVASKCGFTPQYTGLEALWKEYGPKGLAVVGFPCNQFGAQEPGSAEDIRLTTRWSTTRWWSCTPTGNSAGEGWPYCHTTGGGGGK